MRRRGVGGAAGLLLGALGVGLSLGALAAFAPEALADTVHGTRSEKLVERSNVIDIRIDRGSAKLVMRRTLYNGGDRHDQAVIFLNTPDGSAATGLRTLGMVDNKPFWFTGELMEAEAAAAKYRELTGVGGYYPKDPALLSWRSQGLLALQVFPVAPQTPKTVEVTLEMPTEYRGGRHHLTLPKMGTNELAATAVVSPARPHDDVLINDAKVAPGTRITLDKDEIDLAIEPRAVKTVEGALSSIVFGVDRALVSVRVEAAPRLSETPRGAYVAVVIDASRSMSSRDVGAEEAAAAAYLSSFPDAQVSLIRFDREVREAHPGRFVAVRRALDELAQTSLMVTDRRNGSRVDDALARADALLKAAPPNVPKRIVLMTDTLTREAVDADTMKSALKSGAILHVGVIDAGEPSLKRDDDHAWAGLPRSTGGVLWTGSASAFPDDAKTMARIYEEWARPLRIHKAQLLVQGATVDERQEQETLDEGEGIAINELRKDAVARVEMKGELWSKPYSRSFTPSVDEARLSAALVFGSSLFSELQESEMMGLAMLGRAVSPVTSYLAIEPGVRPSTEGLEDMGTGAGMGFGSGSGRLNGRSSCLGLSGYDHEAFLVGKLKSALRACGGGETGAKVSLETTLAEIVDVSSVTVSEPQGASGATSASQATGASQATSAGQSTGAPRATGVQRAAIERCVTEAIWDVILPDKFTFGYKRFTVSI